MRLSRAMVLRFLVTAAPRERVLARATAETRERSFMSTRSECGESVGGSESESVRMEEKGRKGREAMVLYSLQPVPPRLRHTRSPEMAVEQGGVRCESAVQGGRQETRGDANPRSKEKAVSEAE
jgi:hypothetical protein